MYLEYGFIDTLAVTPSGLPNGGSFEIRILKVFRIILFEYFNKHRRYDITCLKGNLHGSASAFQSILLLIIMWVGGLRELGHF